MPQRCFCVASLVAIGVSCALGQTPVQISPTGGVTAVIDTTLGRLRCRLFEAERPKMTAEFIALAEGSVPWVDPVRGALSGRHFYDGTRLYGIPAGVRGGSRTEDSAPLLGLSVAWETEPALKFDRPGRLAIRREKGQPGGTEFMILDHANAEDDGENASVIGQCDEESVAAVTAISHRLAMADNHPDTPIAVNRVVIVREGQPMPLVAENVPAAAVVPVPVAVAKLAVPAPEPSGLIAVIETSMGRLSCRLFVKESPIGTGVFVGLATGTKDWKNPVTQKMEHGKRYYDGMSFDRVIPDFVIQSGDFTGDISGGTDIGFRFKNENTPGLSFDRPGRLAFGNNGPDTNNSEIFISEHPMRRLDGGFTIIGQCDAASVRLVEKIARVPRDANNRPVKPVTIERIHFDSQ